MPAPAEFLGPPPSSPGEQLPAQQPPRSLRPGGPRKHRLSPAKRAILEAEAATTRRQRVFELRREGMSYNEIVELVDGLASSGAAHDALIAYLDAQLEQQLSSAQAKALSLARLDAVIQVCYRLMLTGDKDARRDLLAVERQRAALLGLDEPVHLQVGPAPLPEDLAITRAIAAEVAQAETELLGP